ncbi:formylglycine-generating enzyme family protein [Salinimicrobium xinjiangense]|uniref:formylglycine-generating enzyme family protein n=1 Tax=Salinimicrobium xinjiangense TaxID=438596 RepID=UPI000490520E|nr:formylglycine-generating enzyme family protein [Salinimicrobium xinjiangense]
MRTLTRLAIFIGIMIQSQAYSQSGSMAKVTGGEFIPLYGTKTEVVIGDFLMDVFPVTNEEFLRFVEENPRWRKSQVKKLFADDSYLDTWKDDLNFGEDKQGNAPVTNVSWYAAKNYCECQGKRLPTVDEWEYVAMANEKQPDARTEKSYNQYILSWYETPRTYSNPVGSTFKNYWGVYDLHGLVWEWTSDFNSVMIGGESRKDSTGDNNLFCGAAAVGATDLMNYAAFMRYAFRGSMKAQFSTRNLGFRCVQDIEKLNL